MFVVYHGNLASGHITASVFYSYVLAKLFCYFCLACGQEVYFLEV